jgi:hypothetical protein
MFKQALLILSASALLAQAPYAVPKALLKSEAACVVRVEATTQKIVKTAVSGLAPSRITVDQEFSLTIPGRLEEWEEANGTIEFRFHPDLAAEGREGRFKAQAHEVKPMVESDALIEGNTIVGMGTWYLGAEAFGKEITAYPRDVSALGQVSASSHSALVVGAKQSVQLVMVPRIEREFPSSKQPVLQFPKGPDLWALRTAKAPFSAAGVVRFEHTSPEQDVKGTSRITFELTPKGTPGK